MLLEIATPTGERKWVPLSNIAFIETRDGGDIESCAVIGHDGEQLGTVNLDDPGAHELIARPKRHVIPAQLGYALLWCLPPDDSDVNRRDVDLHNYLTSQEIIGWEIRQLNDGGTRMPVTLDETMSLIYITGDFTAISSPNGQVIDYKGRQFENVDDWMRWVKKEWSE
jgi:hypothetical protein